MKKIFIISVALVGLVAVVDIFFEQKAPAPELDVLATTASDATIDGEYVIYVDCSYSNTGSKSSFVVWAQLTGGEVWDESDEITLGNEEQKVVRFTFTGATLTGTPLTTYQYTCGKGYDPECLLVTLCPRPTPARFLPTRTG
ncbi:MAG: hypothetical protein HQ477_11470 [Chloroflexi bacterium]|nr:hypothetical protein [Chloroflexota bacterium]